jgi:hypothetical protein
MCCDIKSMVRDVSIKNRVWFQTLAYASAPTCLSDTRKDFLKPDFPLFARAASIAFSLIPSEVKPVRGMPKLYKTYIS